MPLRTRLVFVLVALVAIALGVIEAVTYVTTQQSLISKVDSQLSASEHAVLQDLVTKSNNPPSGFGTIAPGTYAVLYTDNGQPVVSAHEQGSLAKPIVSNSFVRELANSLLGTTAHANFPGTHGVDRYRALGAVVQENDPFAAVPPGTYLLVAAIPLTGVESTLGHVLLLEVVVGLLVLLLLGAGSWFLVQVSLRPLGQMANTASEIAAGDLTARIVDVDERTEVGQLGAALNTMLTKIEQAFRDKEASEDQLRRFVADASHELRTPLTSIRGYAELFRNGLADRPDDLASAMRRIESESSRMAGLVEDLLLLARLDQGRPLIRRPVDLTELAVDAVADARVVDPAREITLVAGESCVVNGDEERLQQVLGNLLTNALAYTPPGSPVQVHVDTLERGSMPSAPWAGSAGSGPGNKAVTTPVARLAVVDHGAGIPPGNLPHIFDRFWRADPSRVRASGGAGLGLSIVAAVVSAHGGRVSVEATPGGGASFVVELPVGLEDPADGTPTFTDEEGEWRWSRPDGALTPGSGEDAATEATGEEARR